MAKHANPHGHSPDSDVQLHALRQERPHQKTAPAGKIFALHSKYGDYEVHQEIYRGRLARVLYSGQREAAQSGIALDGKPELLFEYNQRFMELVAVVQPQRILLIGGGAYTLPMALLDNLGDIQLDVVELDGELLPMARDYFGLSDDARLRCITGDGAAYLASTKETYDLIILDVFMHTAPPEAFASERLIRRLRHCLRPGGLVAANIITAYRGQAGERLAEQVQFYAANFESVQLFPAAYDLSPWSAQNIVLVARSPGAPEVTEAFRYSPVSVIDNPAHAPLI